MSVLRGCIHVPTSLASGARLQGGSGVRWAHRPGVCTVGEGALARPEVMGWGSWCAVVGLDKETLGPCHGHACMVTRGSPGQDSDRAPAPPPHSSPKRSRNSRASCAKSPPTGEGGTPLVPGTPATTPATELTLSVQKETFLCEHH